MERLKRLRAAQIDKAFQKEVLTAAQRKLQDERDRRARETIERAAAAQQRRCSPSPPSPPRLCANPPQRHHSSRKETCRHNQNERQRSREAMPRNALHISSNHNPECKQDSSLGTIEKWIHPHRDGAAICVIRSMPCSLQRQLWHAAALCPKSLPPRNSSSTAPFIKCWSVSARGLTRCPGCICAGAGAERGSGAGAPGGAGSAAPARATAATDDCSLCAVS